MKTSLRNCSQWCYLHSFCLTFFSLVFLMEIQTKFCKFKMSPCCKILSFFLICSVLLPLGLRDKQDCKKIGSVMLSVHVLMKRLGEMWYTLHCIWEPTLLMYLELFYFNHCSWSKVNWGWISIGYLEFLILSVDP